MKKYVMLFSLLFCGVSHSMEKNQAKEVPGNDQTGNIFIVHEYGSEIVRYRVDPNEASRVVWVKGRMKMPRPVTFPFVANQRQRLLLEQAEKLRARL